MQSTRESHSKVLHRESQDHICNVGENGWKWILATVNLALGDSGLNLRSAIQVGRSIESLMIVHALPQDGSKNL